MMQRLLVIAALLVIAPVPHAAAQTGIGLQIGNSTFLDDRYDNIRIGAVARKAIEEHLHAAYARLCKKQDENPDICAEQRPFYKGSALRAHSQPLLPELQKKVSFVYPGTQYRQIGFSVYLVGQPRARIFDVVSLWNDRWN